MEAPDHGIAVLENARCRRNKTLLLLFVTQADGMNVIGIAGNAMPCVTFIARHRTPDSILIGENTGACQFFDIYDLTAYRLRLPQ